MRHMVSDIEGELLDEAVAKVFGGWNYETRRQLAGAADWSPSTSWTDGGTIVEREKIVGQLTNDGIWIARCGAVRHPGRTQLIASMRAYVGCYVGDEIDLP